MRISDWSSDVCSSDLHRNKLTVMENELVNMVCGCHDEAGLRPVNSIARCDLLPAGAAETLPPAFLCIENRDRKSVVSGKSVSVRVDLGGRRLITTQTNTTT